MAANDTKPTLQAVTNSAENNPEISVQRIEVDIVREELLDEDDVTYGAPDESVSA